MIYVDALFDRATPWGGRQTCHLISDHDVGELLDFARRVGLPLAWFQARATVPHFDLSPSWRARAIAGGATEANPREFVDAMRRWRTANPSMGA